MPRLKSPARDKRKNAKTTFQKLTARAPTFREALSKKIGEIDQHRAVANAARAPSFSIGAEYSPGLGFVPVSRDSWGLSRRRVEKI
jgi:hypothetical protein